jgi:hypothetical protein
LPLQLQHERPTRIVGRPPGPRPTKKRLAPGFLSADESRAYSVGKADEAIQNFREILAKLRDHSVFSIGDTNDFIAEGGGANLWIESGKVRIETNAGAAKVKNLRISSRLMQLAKIVQ